VKKAFLVRFALVLSLLALAAPVLAAPGQCDVVCTCASRCTQLCSDGGTITNCFNGGICVGQCLAATAPVEKGDALLSSIFGEQRDAAAPVVPAVLTP